jgi:hypothetical protein
MAKNSSFKKGSLGLRECAAGCCVGEARDVAPAGCLFLIVFGDMGVEQF